MGMNYKLYHPQAIHELGRRQNQEDAIYPLPNQVNCDHRVFVVCDGMGGLDKGEVASEAVCKTLGRVAETILHTLGTFTDDDLAHCMSAAYEALDAADTDNEAAMGTTMTFLCFHEQGCLVAHIGDSRIYHLRPSLGAQRGVLFRSRDHSLVHQLYEMGEISYNDMAKYPKKNIILKGMQPHQVERIRPSMAHIGTVWPGDYFLLCTDGMLEKMDDEQLMALLGDTTLTLEQKTQQLVEMTSGNSDNHSAYLIQVEKVQRNAVEDANIVDDEIAHRIRNKVLNDNHRDKIWHFDDAIPMPEL
jgi:protein phosphatase